MNEASFTHTVIFVKGNYRQSAAFEDSLQSSGTREGYHELQHL
jgi:hypothetical protein